MVVSLFNLKTTVQLNENKIVYLAIFDIFDFCHCEEQSDEAISPDRDCFAKLAEKTDCRAEFTQSTFASLSAGSANVPAITKHDNIIGYLELNRVLELCDIVHLEIKNEFRHQGIGTKFLEFAMSELKERGMKNIFLEVRKSNIAAMKLYKNLGFCDIEVRGNYYKNPTEDAIVMVKKYD